MNTNRTFTRVLLVVAAITVAALGIAALVGLATNRFHGFYGIGPGGATMDESRSYQVAGTEAIAIEATSDDVRVTQGTGHSLEVRLHGRAGVASPDLVPRLVDERTGSTLTVRVDRTPSFHMGFTWSNLVLDVSVPAGSAGKLFVKTSSGGVSLADGTYAGLALAATSGDVQVGSVSAGDFSVKTTSGTLTAAVVAAKGVDLSSASGDIRVGSLTGNATLHSTSGSMNVAFEAVPGRIDAQSTSGDVTLRMPGDAVFVLDARTGSGDITCAFPIMIAQGAARGDRHALAGTVGGAAGTGTGQLAVRTTSGSIRIEK